MPPTKAGDSGRRPLSFGRVMTRDFERVTRSGARVYTWLWRMGGWLEAVPPSHEISGHKSTAPRLWPALAPRRVHSRFSRGSSPLLSPPPRFAPLPPRPRYMPGALFPSLSRRSIKAAAVSLFPRRETFSPASPEIS